MRFVTSGKNWEGRSWVLAPGLVKLAQQIDAMHPKAHATDGTVASKGHDSANPKSDHRPTPYTGKGTVRAIDFGETVENHAFNIMEAIRKSKDKRVKYGIHEGRIFSSYASGGIAPFTWRPYTGANPHAAHGHISTLKEHDSVTTPWQIGAPAPPKPPTGGTYTVEATRSDVKKGSEGKMVKLAQSLLAAQGYPPANSFDPKGVPDGKAGDGFDTAVRNFQKAKKLSVDGIVGAKTWTALEKA